ncbi:unnamed protein product [Lepeophtheirus salmonis]|uniref:(salmon louse) hypothetical protein n=1 Tax=Lepeophtheirus salmonis TaxID=72036 RepID=A0A7R8HCC5_LEPSM|nr:unnamed protein product [Lepeophtheirus salmonis]CAF3004470.1 unnamed protein product [Lepeophtheirus salmonis]
MLMEQWPILLKTIKNLLSFIFPHGELDLDLDLVRYVFSVSLLEENDDLDGVITLEELVTSVLSFRSFKFDVYGYTHIINVIEHDERPELISTNVEEDDIANSNEENLKAPDGTEWFEIPLEVSDTVERFRTKNVLTDSPGPTLYAKRNVDYGSMMSTFSVFIDNFII